MKNKKAFTLAEILTVIFIIGVVSTAALYTLKNKNQQYKKLYYTAYNTLLQTVGNAYLQWNPESGKCAKNLGETDEAYAARMALSKEFYWSSDCWKFYVDNHYEEKAIDGMDGFPRQYPGFLFGEPTKGNFDGSGTDENFCKSLIKNINILDSNNACKSFISGIRNDVNLGIGNDFRKTFCTIEIATEETDATGQIKRTYQCHGKDKGRGAEGITPSFVAANGQKFYISVIQTANPPYIDNSPSSGEGSAYERMQFRFVVVDLNGDNGPNSQLKKGNMLPDQVLFAIRTDGTVVPLGLPEFDESYLNVYVDYPKKLPIWDSDKSDYKDNDKLKSELMSLFDAKMIAWAGDASGGGATTYFGQLLVPSEPLSFSNLLYFFGSSCYTNGQYETAGKCSTTGKNDFYNGITYHVDDLMSNLIRQFTYTAHGSDEDFIVRSVETSNLDTAHGCTFGYSKCKIEFSR